MGLDFESLPAPLRRRRKIPRQLAVALGFEPGADHAPEVVAKGYGLLARRIIELAREQDVPVHEDADLAEVLSNLEVGAEIPDELYEAVAQLLAFIYRMNGVFKPSAGGGRVA